MVSISALDRANAVHLTKCRTCNGRGFPEEIVQRNSFNFCKPHVGRRTLHQLASRLRWDEDSTPVGWCSRATTTHSAPPFACRGSNSIRHADDYYRPAVSMWCAAKKKSSHIINKRTGTPCNDQQNPNLDKVDEVPKGQGFRTSNKQELSVFDEGYFGSWKNKRTGSSLQLCLLCSLFPVSDELVMRCMYSIMSNDSLTNGWVVAHFYTWGSVFGSFSSGTKV